MTTVICTATSFSLTPENGRNGFVPAGTTYQWNEPTYSNDALDGGETVSSGQNSIYGTLTNSGSRPYTATYNVVASTPNCGGVTFSVIVTVDPKPSVTPMSTVVCSGVGFVVSPVDGTNGLVPVGTRYEWLSPDGVNLNNRQPGSNQLTINGTLTNSVNVQRTATYLVTPSYGACSGLTQSGNQFTVTVFVDPTPSVTSIALSPLCTGSVFAVTPTAGIIPSGMLHQPLRRMVRMVLYLWVRHIIGWVLLLIYLGD